MEFRTSAREDKFNFREKFSSDIYGRISGISVLKVDYRKIRARSDEEESRRRRREREIGEVREKR